MTITEKEFQILGEYVYGNYGINLTGKKVLVEGRLQHVVQSQKFSCFSEYLGYVLSDTSGTAISELINRITTNYTYFAREPDHFSFFRKTILPDLLIKEQYHKDLRLWSAGCASGEEPYTLAMVIDSFFGGEKQGWNAQILATDISTKMLDAAVTAVYSGQQLLHLPPQWKLYFSRLSEDRYQLSAKMRKEVIFRRFNLMADFPFKKKFHAVFCRNVMIYFDKDAKQQLIDKFYNHTEQGGYLFIGYSETLKDCKSRYRYVRPAVYRKE